LLLLLIEDVNGALQFPRPRTLPVDVLSMSLSALGGYLSSHDGLLLLPKPLYLLLDPDQLILLSLGFIFFYFITILDLDLVEFSFILVDLRWQRWVGVEVLVTSLWFGWCLLQWRTCWPTAVELLGCCRRLGVL
jgi:hypothetical protein